MGKMRLIDKSLENKARQIMAHLTKGGMCPCGWHVGWLIWSRDVVPNMERHVGTRDFDKIIEHMETYSVMNALGNY